MNCKLPFGGEPRSEVLASNEFDPQSFIPADYAALEGNWSWFNGIVEAATANGFDGMVADDVSTMAPWGFDLADITAPTLIMHGTATEWCRAHTVSGWQHTVQRRSCAYSPARVISRCLTLHRAHLPGFARSSPLGPSALEGKSLGASRRPCTHLAAFSSVDIRPGIPPSSALRCTHLNDAKRQGTSLPGH